MSDGDENCADYVDPEKLALKMARRVLTGKKGRWAYKLIKVGSVALDIVGIVFMLQEGIEEIDPDENSSGTGGSGSGGSGSGGSGTGSTDEGGDDIAWSFVLAMLLITIQLPDRVFAAWKWLKEHTCCGTKKNPSARAKKARKGTQQKKKKQSGGGDDDEETGGAAAAESGDGTQEAMQDGGPAWDAEDEEMENAWSLLPEEAQDALYQGAQWSYLQVTAKDLKVEFKPGTAFWYCMLLIWTVFFSFVYSIFFIIVAGDQEIEDAILSALGVITMQFALVMQARNFSKYMMDYVKGKEGGCCKCCKVCFARIIKYFIKVLTYCSFLITVTGLVFVFGDIEIVDAESDADDSSS